MNANPENTRMRGSMSYAEQTAQDVLDIINRHGSMEEIVARIEETMLAQREADAQTAFAATFGWGSLEISPQDVMTRRLELKEAVLNGGFFPRTIRHASLSANGTNAEA